MLLKYWAGTHQVGYASPKSPHSILYFADCCWRSLQKYIGMAASLEGLSPYVPLYKVMEGNEPCLFTSYFSWDPVKATVCAAIELFFSLLLYQVIRRYHLFWVNFTVSDSHEKKLFQQSGFLYILACNILVPGLQG